MEKSLNFYIPKNTHTQTNESTKQEILPKMKKQTNKQLLELDLAAFDAEDEISGVPIAAIGICKGNQEGSSQ